MLRNVLLFSLGASRWALELRWVREVERMAPIADVPGAPATVAGVINLRGQIVPVIGPSALPAPLGHPREPRAPRKTDQAILIDVDGMPAVLCADRIDEVTSLAITPDGHAVRTGDGTLVALVDPPAVLAEIRAQVEAAAQALSARVWGPS